MEATLVVVEGEAVAPQFQLNLPAIIGRSKNADVKIGHPLVSRQHCELFESEGTLMVRDLGSLNGTFVGDTRIASETSLEPGGLLTIGSVTFRAEYEAAAHEAEGEEAGAFAPFAPLGGIGDAAGEETVQMGAMPSMESLEEPVAESAEEGFGWLGDDEGAAVAEAPAEGAAVAEEAVEEELSFDEPEAPAAEMAETAEVADDLNIEQADELNFDLDNVEVEENAAEPLAEVAEEPQELELSFDDPEETQEAPVAAAPAVEEEPAELDLEEVAVEEAAAEELAPVAEDDFGFAPPEEEQNQEGGEGDGDLDDFFNNLK